MTKCVNKVAYSRTGFLNLNTIGILGLENSLWWGLSGALYDV